MEGGEGWGDKRGREGGGKVVDGRWKVDIKVAQWQGSITSKCLQFECDSGMD